MKRLLYLALMLLIVSSCSNNEQDVKIIKADKIDFNDWASLMEIVEVVTFPETQSAPKLSVANECMVTDHRIFFWDNSAGLVYAYDIEGNYLFTVGGIGRSDREYISINDIALTPDQSEIHILDKSGVKEYDAETGAFLRKKTFSSIDCSTIQAFQPCGNDEFYVFTREKDHSICKIDADDKITMLRKRNGYQMVYKRFLLTNNRYMILPDYGQFTIDSIKENKIVPSYKIDLGSNSLPKNMIPADFESFAKVDDSKDYFKVVLDSYENDEFLYALLVGPNHVFYDLFYSKAKDKVYMGPTDDSTNIVFVGMDNEYLYGLVYLDYVKETSPYYDLLSPYKEKNLLNPLLVKLKLKNV